MSSRTLERARPREKQSVVAAIKKISRGQRKRGSCLVAKCQQKNGQGRESVGDKEEPVSSRREGRNAGFAARAARRGGEGRRVWVAESSSRTCVVAIIRMVGHSCNAGAHATECRVVGGRGRKGGERVLPLAYRVPTMHRLCTTLPLPLCLSVCLFPSLSLTMHQPRRYRESWKRGWLAAR